MRTHAFGGRDVSVIGLGTSHFGGKRPESQAREDLDGFVAVGGNLIDTARVYGDFSTPKDGESEKVIGRWMSERHNRERLFLSTKGGHPNLKGVGTLLRIPRLSPGEIRADMAASLEDLQTDQVDIYWLHRDDPRRPVGEIMETLQGLIEAGQTRLVGVSNWKAGRIAEALRYAETHGLSGLAGNQTQFSLARSRMIGDPTLVAMTEPMYRLHLETGLACFCFSAQAGGYLAKRAAGAKISPALAIEYQSRQNEETLRAVSALSAETGLSVAALSIAYLTSQPFPTFALVGVSRPAHLEALRESGDALLTPDQLRRLHRF